MDTNTPKDTVHIKIDISKDLHRKLKILAAERDTTMGALLLAALSTYAAARETGWKG